MPSLFWNEVFKQSEEPIYKLSHPSGVICVLPSCCSQQPLLVVFYFGGAHLAATFSISPQNCTHLISHVTLLTVCRSSKQQHFYVAHEHFRTSAGHCWESCIWTTGPWVFQRAQLIQRTHFLLKSALKRETGEREQDSPLPRWHVNCQPKLTQNGAELIIFLTQSPDGFPLLGPRDSPSSSPQSWAHIQPGFPSPTEIFAWSWLLLFQLRLHSLCSQQHTSHFQVLFSSTWNWLSIKTQIKPSSHFHTAFPSRQPMLPPSKAF